MAAFSAPMIAATIATSAADHRAQRLAGYSGEGGDLLSEGYRLGSEGSLLQAFLSPLGAPSAAPCIRQTSQDPQGWRTAL